MIGLALLTLLFAATGAVQAQEPIHAHGSPYAGEEVRTIKSLSPEDVAELRRGGGWGQAKAAELNGMPGPAHLLQLQDEIGLDPGQVAVIQDLFATMEAGAIAEGERLIALEQELDEQFRQRTITDQSLRDLLAEITATRGQLRYIHLAAHLATPGILTQAQIDRYNELRGYRHAGCAAAPAGHDPAMWRRHNGCAEP